MLCDKCKINPATIKYQQIFNGKQTTMNLCSQCAAKGVSVSPFDIGGVDLNGFIASVFNLANHGNPLAATKCPVCGYTLEKFNQTGLLGCDRCYEAFRSDLQSVIKSIQGSTHHVAGDVSVDEVEQAADEIAKLRAELYEAVKKEDYEKAVILRDRLKELEKASLDGGEKV